MDNVKRNILEQQSKNGGITFDAVPCAPLAVCFLLFSVDAPADLPVFLNPYEIPSPVAITPLSVGCPVNTSQSVSLWTSLESSAIRGGDSFLCAERSLYSHNHATA